MKKPDFFGWFWCKHCYLTASLLTQWNIPFNAYHLSPQGDPAHDDYVRLITGKTKIISPTIILCDEQQKPFVLENPLGDMLHDKESGKLILMQALKLHDFNTSK